MSIKLEQQTERIALVAEEFAMYYEDRALVSE